MSVKTVERFIKWLEPFNPTRSYLLSLFHLDRLMVRGTGHLLYDSEGMEYLDFLSQFGAVSLGHNHPELCDTLILCLKNEVPSMVQPLLPKAAQDLAQILANITPGDLAHSVFTNSGSEAVEAAIKLARAKTGRMTIVSTINGFHGSTLGALSATGRNKYQKPFGAPVAGFEHIPYGELDSLEARLRRHDDLPAAFLIEPIQGEGGVILPPQGYIASALALCRQHNVLSILDETQTGLGRTGKLFALPDGAGVPDILLIAKALGGGLFPIGACVCTQRTWDHEFGYLHNSTFANNNLACTVAAKVIEIMTRDDQKLIREVERQGNFLFNRLLELKARYPRVIKDVRGRGLLVGVEFHPFTGNDSYTMAYFSNGDYLIAMLSGYLLNVHRVLTAPVFSHSHVLRLEPPFTIGEREVNRMISALDTMCDAIDRKDYFAIVRYLVGSTSQTTSRPQFAVPNRPNPSRIARTATKKGSFAFFIHPTEDQDLVCCDPSFEQFSSSEFVAWKNYLEETEPSVVYHLDNVRSVTDSEAEGWLIAVGLLPDRMLKSSLRKTQTILKDGLSLAKDKGARILGLGGFTSVVTKGGQSLTGQGIAITSGSCLTSVVTVESLIEVVERSGRGMSELDLTIVGATGAVGRLTALLLAQRVDNLTLLGNPSSRDSKDRLLSVADEIRTLFSRRLARTSVADHHGNSRMCHEPMSISPHVECSWDLNSALTNADIVVVATNAVTSLINPGHLRPGTIVCDISKPRNVSDEVVQQRPDVFVFDGGLVELPDVVHFGPNLQGFRPGVTLGCLAEAMLLALEQDYNDHSIGQKLTLEEAEYIGSLARKHGFCPAAPHWKNRKYSDADFLHLRSVLSELRTRNAMV